MALRLYNTLMRQKEDFVPVKEEARWGFTPAGSPSRHLPRRTRPLGHQFRHHHPLPALSGLQGHLRQELHRVDDKIIIKANKEGVGFRRDLRALQFAEHNDDMDRLASSAPPSHPGPRSTSRG